jgi:hypothetical protein
VDRTKGGRLPEPIIDALLESDIREVEGIADGHVPWWRDLAPARQIVMLDLLFNPGWNEAAARRPAPASTWARIAKHTVS